MASTFNIKGTSNSSFQIGKGGVTLYQGITPPPNGSYITGDRYLQRGDSANQPRSWYYNGTTWVSEDSVSLPLNLSSGTTTVNGNGSILNFNVGSTLFDSGTTSFGNTVSFNGTTTFSGSNAPTSSVTISDIPGNTSGKLSTTSWVDQYYSSKASIWNTGNPIGTIISFSGAVIPDTYLLCDGSSFNATLYPDLYNFLGSNNLPDLRGMFLRGLDTTGNIDNVPGGRKLMSFEEGSRTTGEWSTDMVSFSNIATTSRLVGMQGLGWDIPSNTSESFPVTHMSGVFDVHAGYNIGEPLGITRPKNVSINYVIKAKVTSNGTDGDFIPVNATKAVNVTSNGNIVFDTLKVSGSITDTPGNTSTTVPTTHWVDTNYASKSSLTTLQNNISNQISNSNTQYITVDVADGNIGLGLNPSRWISYTAGTEGTQITGTSAIAIGSGISAGSNSIILGSGNATGSNSIAVGSSSANSVDSLAFGNGGSVQGGCAIGIGNNIESNAQNSIVIGNNSSVSDGITGTNCIVIGTNATSSEGLSISIGYNTQSKNIGCAIGSNAIIQGNNAYYAVALGSNSVASESCTVSVGSGNPSDDYTGYRRITNVADGTNPHDAVTLEQLQAATGGSTSSDLKGLINTQVFSTPGTFTYTPTSGTNKIIVKLCGGGGGGGGAPPTNTPASGPLSFSCGGGGAGGTYAESTIIPVPTSSTTVVTVGAGGIAGSVTTSTTNTSSAGNGGLSSFGTYITCPGGIGGNSLVGTSIASYAILYATGTEIYSINEQAATGNVAFSVLGGTPSIPVATTYYPTTIVCGSGGGSSFLSSASDFAIYSGASGTSPAPGVLQGPTAKGIGAGGSGGLVANMSNGSSQGSGGSQGGNGIVIVEEYA